MAKRTKTVALIPLANGLDKTSIPGTQEPTSVNVAKNMILKNKKGWKKFPGVERINYIGDDDGNLQNAIQFYATVGNSQKEELIRIINGEVQTNRDGIMQSLDLIVHPTDVITFDRFANVLIIYFENTRPYYYRIGESLTALPILASHITSPPRFSTVHYSRLMYSGRYADPHKVWACAYDDPFDYTLANGGFSMSVRDGDGDPVGITGLSKPFRGDVYAFKYCNIYCLKLTEYGYAVIDVTNEVGCVHHNTIVTTQNDIYFVSRFGIHSLAATDKYGSVEEATITYPIYEWFQEEINWNAAKYMQAYYDKQSNAYLLSYASSGSATPDKIIGFNTLNKQFFGPWEINCPVLGRYIDNLKERTLVGSQEYGLGYFNNDLNTYYGNKIKIELTTGVLMPGTPKSIFNFTKAWITGKPTNKNTELKIYIYIDGLYVGERTIDTYGGGEGAIISETSMIGYEKIGINRKNTVTAEFEVNGLGSSIEFQVIQDPPENDIDQSCEVYGITYEIEYDEDTEVTTVS